MSAHATTTDIVYAKSRVLLVDQYDHVLLMLTRHDVDGYPARWLTTGGLASDQTLTLPSTVERGLTVKIWTARRPAVAERNAA